MELELVTAAVDIPRNTGIEGFLQMLRSLLRIKRLQEIVISVTRHGSITYKYLAERETEQTALDPCKLLENLNPMHYLQRSEMKEVGLQEGEASPQMLLRLFRAAENDGMRPICWVVGAGSALPRWLRKGTTFTEDFAYPNETLCGLPILSDRFVPDEALVLCAGHGIGSEMSDARICYKTTMVMT